AHNGIGVRLSTHETGVWKLPFPVPLQQVDLGDAQGLARTAMARNDVNAETAPARRPPSRHDATRWVRDDEIRCWIETHLGEAPPEKILIAPVGGRLAAIQQPGGCEQHRAGACRVDHTAALVAAAEPCLHVRMAIAKVVRR